MINLMANDVWSEADILNHVRAITTSQVSEQRQDELQTIMLGHIAGMRTATPAEMQEVGMVAQLVEQGAAMAAQARVDMATLQKVLDYEAVMAVVDAYTSDPDAQALLLLRHPAAEVISE